jgi:hypothetical protein
MAASKDTHLITLILKAVDLISPESDKATKSLQEQKKVLEDLEKQNKGQNAIHRNTEKAAERRAKALENELNALQKLRKEREKLEKDGKLQAQRRASFARVEAGFYESAGNNPSTIRRSLDDHKKWVLTIKRQNGEIWQETTESLKRAKEIALEIEENYVNSRIQSLEREEKKVREKINREVQQSQKTIDTIERQFNKSIAERNKKEKEASEKSIEIAKKESRSRVEILKDEHEEIERLRKSGAVTGSKEEQSVLRQKAAEQELKTRRTITDVNGEAIEIEKRVRRLRDEGHDSDSNALQTALKELNIRKFEAKELRHIAALQRESNQQDNLRLKSLNMAQETIAATNEDIEEAYAMQEKFNKDEHRRMSRIRGDHEKANRANLKIILDSSKKKKDLADLEVKYIELLGKERDYLIENNDHYDLRNAKQKAMRAEIDHVRNQLHQMGGDYEELDKLHEQRLKRLEEENELIEKNKRVEAERAPVKFGFDKDKSFVQNIVRNYRVLNRENGRTQRGFRNVRNRFRDVMQSAADLTRRLGRLGLAMRGLVIVGVLAFTRALVATISALIGAVIGLAGSLVYAAGALGGTFVAAGLQALPVIGLLIAAFQRLKLIQEAVNQQGLLEKQAFGDSGSGPAEQDDTAARQIADNSRQIADAQRALKEAQEGVTQARKDARKELKDLILAEKEAELALRGAVLSQSEAQRSLRASISGGDVEGIARAQLDRDSSRFDTRKAMRDLRNARRERRAGIAGGPEGTETYKNAVKAVADAQRGLADAQRGLADAHRTSAQAATTQLAAERNLNHALSELTESEKKLYRQFMKFKERFAKVTKPITDIIIRAFSDAFSNVEKLLFNKNILGAFTQLANVLGDSLRRVSEVISGPEFTKFFINLIGESSKNLPIITEAFLNLAKILGNIATGAAPALTRLFNYINDGLARFVDYTSDSTKLDNFFQTGLDHLEAWMSLFGAIGRLFGELMGASSDSQLGLLRDFTDTINKAKEALEADDSGARHFFKESAESLSHIGEVLVALGDAFVQLSGSEHVKALADIFVKGLIPGLILGIQTLGYFALAVDKLLDYPISGTFIKWSVAMFVMYAGLNSIIGLFTPFFKALRHIGAGFRWVFGQLGGSGIQLFSKLNTVIGKQGLLGALRLLPKALAGIPVIGLIIAAVIETIIGAVSALKDNFLGVTDFVKDEFSQVGDVFSDLGDSLGELWNEITGGTEGLKGFLNVLGDVISFAFKAISFVGKLAGAFAIFTIIRSILPPIRMFIGTLAAIVKHITRVIKTFKRLFSGEINFGEFLAEMGENLIGFFKDIFLVVAEEIFNGFKGIGKLIWNALTLALENVGLGIANTIVNAIIDVLNFVIRKINSISVLGKSLNISEVGEVDLRKETPEKDRPRVSSISGRQRERGSGLEESEGRSAKKKGDAREKSGKKTKKATDFEKGYADALFHSGNVNKRNVKLNNQLVDSLQGTSKAHKRAQNLQEQLNKATNRGRNSQERYVEAIRKVAKAEERLNAALRRTRNLRGEYNQTEDNSIKIKNNMVEASRRTTNSQAGLNQALMRGAEFQGQFNAFVGIGIKRQDKYEANVGKTTKSTKDQSGATKVLSRRFGTLNNVLRTTGENSRALGLVFKQVTNRILTEFNANPIKVDLPEVGSMFREATGGGGDGFQTGGYFGDKRKRGPDDRLIKVAGGEAILTGHQQKAANTAFAIANQTVGYKYDSLDTLFKKDSRTHSSAPAFQKGGYAEFNRGGRANRRRGTAGGKSIVIPESVPDAMGALPGLDLVAWLSNKYFGVPVSDGIRAAGTTTSSGYISDHTWGGAVDLSNGGAPTPQMDAAWRWFAEVLGGGAPAGFVENFSGGAIKQMLYRTNIGGNHFNHIHIALLETYARNVEQLTKILTGRAVPVVTGDGMMFAQAPQLKKPDIKGTKGAPKRMLQGQSDRLTSAANKLLKRRIQAAPGGNASYQTPTTVAIEPGSKVQTGYTVYNDPPPGSFGALDQGYAELGTATVGGLTGGGYLAQAFGLDGELPENFPLNVTINGRTKKLYKRDRGWGQGSNSHGIDIWQDSWPFFGLNANSSGSAIVKTIDAQRGKRERQHQRGGFVLPEFDSGGIVPGAIGEPILIKAHGGETVLPTHKDAYNNGGFVSGGVRGGEEYEVRSKKTSKKVSELAWRRQIKRVQQQINKLIKRADNAEKRTVKEQLREQILNLKDRIQAIKARSEFNDEIKEIKKDIKDKQKEINKEDNKDKRKNLQEELKDLNNDLRDVIREKRSLKVFRGSEYDLTKVNDFILLISDRLEYFMAQLETSVAKAALATANWTYKIRKVGRRQLVTRVNTAVQEAQRALSDLVEEYRGIQKEIGRNRAARKQTMKYMRKTRQRHDKEINSLKRKLGKADDEEEREEIRKEIEKVRKNRRNDLDKLRTSLKNTNNKYSELLNKKSENIASRYEAQIAIYEEAMGRFDQRLGMVDTRIKIAELKNQDDEGNLTEAGKAQVKSLYGQREKVLMDARARIQRELAQAEKLKDKERTRELRQQLLDNELALLENTQSIKDLDKAVDKNTDTFTFKSTSWDLFRRAVLNGQGQILPEFAASIPQLSTGGYIQKDGIAYLHAAEVVVPAGKATSNGGPLVDKIEFTQPLEVADPIAISNQIGFKLSTLKAI